MENDQNSDLMDAWIQYLSAQHVSRATQHEAALLMRAVFDAIDQGDSCIPCTWNEAKVLGDLVAYAEGQTDFHVRPFVYTHGALYLYRYWRLEARLAQSIVQFKQHDVDVVHLDTQHLALLEDPHQQRAMQMVAAQRLSMITGGPGTGKTYTLARIIAVLNQCIPQLRIAMAAPTGKAAQRMKEALQGAFNDKKLASLMTDDLKTLNPITIHRLLGLGESQQPRYHERRHLPFDLVVVDEASMLDLQLATQLFASLGPSTRLILLGDANQLASVDVGTVLANLQQVPALAENRVNLVTSRRFDGEQLIGRMAQFIQDNTSPDDALDRFEQQIVAPKKWKQIELSSGMDDVIQLEYLSTDLAQNDPAWEQYYDQLMLGFSAYATAISHYKLHAHKDMEQVQKVISEFDEYRILTAIRYGRLGLQQVNQQMEERLLCQTQQHKQGEWYIGRPVMMTYNDYQLGLSNGDVGVCLQQMHQGRLQFSVYFPSLQKWVIASRLPKNILTAYAMTIHKSQGSEFRHTAVVLEAAATNLLSKELIYTAITRAKKVVSLLVDPSAFKQSMSVKTTRTSGLTAQIEYFFTC